MPRQHRPALSPGEALERHPHPAQGVFGGIVDDEGRARQAELDRRFPQKAGREGGGEQVGAWRSAALGEDGIVILDIRGEAPRPGRGHDARGTFRFPMFHPGVAQGERDGGEAHPGIVGKSPEPEVRLGEYVFPGHGRDRARGHRKLPRLPAPARPLRSDPADACDDGTVHSGFPFRMRATLIPPKPELVLSRYRPPIGCGRGLTGKPHRSMGSRNPAVGGSVRSASDRRPTATSIPPAAPKVCPMAPLSEFSGMRRDPKTASECRYLHLVIVNRPRAVCVDGRDVVRSDRRFRHRPADGLNQAATVAGGGGDVGGVVGRAPADDRADPADPFPAGRLRAHHQQGRSSLPEGKAVAVPVEGAAAGGIQRLQRTEAGEDEFAHEVHADDDHRIGAAGRDHGGGPGDGDRRGGACAADVDARIGQPQP